MDAKPRYQIRIENNNYEGSTNAEEANKLFSTVDQTCLSYYKGKTKSLVMFLNGNEKILCSDIIR